MWISVRIRPLLRRSYIFSSVGSDEVAGFNWGDTSHSGDISDFRVGRKTIFCHEKKSKHSSVGSIVKGWQKSAKTIMPWQVNGACLSVRPLCLYNSAMCNKWCVPCHASFFVKDSSCPFVLFLPLIYFLSNWHEDANEKWLTYRDPRQGDIGCESSLGRGREWKPVENSCDQVTGIVFFMPFFTEMT